MRSFVALKLLAQTGDIIENKWLPVKENIDGTIWKTEFACIKEDSMGMRIGLSSSNVREITLKDIDGKKVGTITITKSSKKKSKRLQYNFKEISSQIMMSKTSGSAGRVVILARAKVALLQKQLKNSDYDCKELEHAIIHAKKMERIARKRVKHLQQEEKAKQKGSCSVEGEENKAGAWENMDKNGSLEVSEEELERLMREYQELMEEVTVKPGEVTELEELSDEMIGAVETDMTPEDLERLKKKHRSDELREIMEADMKYLKALFGKLEKERQEASGGVSLELSGVEIPVQVTEAAIVEEGAGLDVTV